ncbi:MAG TPA: PilN domain-containing protein [bacterium]|nr:PilN domain-containing protein [bacterium]
MEITLNLLPPHLLRQRDDRRRKRTRLVIAAAAVLPVALAYGLLHARIQVLRFQSNSLQRQIVALTPLSQKAQRLDAELTALRQRDEALNRLTARLPRWSAALVGVRDLVPSDAWLTSLSINNGQLAMTGQAGSETTVSTLTTRMASAKFLTGTSLKYVRQSLLGTRQFYTFEIDATVRGEGPTP